MSDKAFFYRYNRLCFNIPAIIKRTVEELVSGVFVQLLLHFFCLIFQLQDSAWQPSIGGESYSNASSSLVYYNLEKSIGSDWSSLQDSQGVMFVPQQKLDEIAMKLASTKEVVYPGCVVWLCIVCTTSIVCFVCWSEPEQ